MQKHCKEQCGGHCPCSLDSELGDESRKLECGDISLIVDASTKNEVILWTGERGSKTRYGESARAFNPTAQATSNERCPVNYYKSFKSLLGYYPSRFCLDYCDSNLAPRDSLEDWPLQYIRDSFKNVILF